MQPVIILFAKTPIPGRVKTRLLPRLTAAQAASLHIAFVNDLLERIVHNEFTVELHTDTDTDVWSGAGVTLRRQHEGDLGLKMFHALHTALEAGAPQAMIVGSDAPGLPVGHLRDLLSAGSDVALGPTEDGGYYAIAARRVCPGMFNDVQWSTPEALAQTLAACRRCGLSTSLGLRWFDVDEPADLDRLAGMAELPRHTAEWLRVNAVRSSRSNANLMTWPK